MDVTPPNARKGYIYASWSKSDMNSVQKVHPLRDKIRTLKSIAYSMEDDLGLGAFVITEFIKGKTLDKSRKENSKKPKSGLQSNIDEKLQEIVYRQVANFFLDLAEHKFDRIGSLSFDDGGILYQDDHRSGGHQLVEQERLHLDDADEVEQICPELKRIKILREVDANGKAHLVEKNHITLRMLFDAHCWI